MARPQSTIYVGGLAPSSDESTLMTYFQPFGEILEVKMPRQRTVEQGASQNVGDATSQQLQIAPASASTAAPHRGFGFVVFAERDEADNAIDNMHLNELEGRIINVTLAKPLKGGSGGAQGGAHDSRRAIWDDEEWIKEHGIGHQEPGNLEISG